MNNRDRQAVRKLHEAIEELLDSPLFRAPGPLHQSARDWDEGETNVISGDRFTTDRIYGEATTPVPEPDKLTVAKRAWNAEPSQRVPSTGVPEHRGCLREYYGDTHQFPGDVRRCPHGHVQVLTIPGGRLAGPGTWYWRDISKWWDPWLYRRAVKVLDAQG